MLDRREGRATARSLVVAGLAASGFLALAVVAHRTGVSSPELDVFRWFNRWPDPIGRPLWLEMQLGSLAGALLVGGFVMGLLRGWWGLLAAGVAAVAAWFLARVAKAWVDRGRPADYLDAVNARFTDVLHGGGYPSGHAAVSFAVATVVAGALRGWWAVVPYVAAVLVAVGRLYFGAHLPLDVLGGAALGVAVGASVRALVVPA